VGKILQLIAPPLQAAGASSHGTTGTMVNPALPTTVKIVREKMTRQQLRNKTQASVTNKEET